MFENTFVLVLFVILIDLVLGVLLKLKEGKFDIRKLPQFLRTGILPYVGSLGVIYMATQMVGDPFEPIFYAAAATVIAKYLAEIKDKLEVILDVSIF